MHEKLLELETKIINKINELHLILIDQQHKTTSNINMDTNEIESRYLYKNLGDSIVTTIAPSSSKKPLAPKKAPAKKSIKSIEKSREFDLEVLKYNNTMIDGEFGNTFVYYWTIEDIEKTLLEQDVFVTSPHFLIKGNNNYILFLYKINSSINILLKYRHSKLNQLIFVIAHFANT